ncbi:hypothetical protein G9A89_004802 [Geosiphon pyriformis]|nr:hypothetical protein G9A89_004802 [Geosiphon pyriformis]
MNLCLLSKKLSNQIFGYKTFRYQYQNTNQAPKNQHQLYHPKVAESELIEANHLGFVKSLFQHYCQHLKLNHNHISAESVFNFYINKRIVYLLRTLVNTNLPTNHNFTSIITEINKEIEYHTQQRYPITYANKGKRKLQTLAVTSQKIQPLTWKKTKVELPTNPSYHYTPGSAINITSTDFGTVSPWEVMDSEEQEKEEEESKNQEFTYQNLITENPEIETPNFQTQHNQND